MDPHLHLLLRFLSRWETAGLGGLIPKKLSNNAIIVILGGKKEKKMKLPLSLHQPAGLGSRGTGLTVADGLRGCFSGQDSYFWKAIISVKDNVWNVHVLTLNLSRIQHNMKGFRCSGALKNGLVPSAPKS